MVQKKKAPAARQAATLTPAKNLKMEQRRLAFIRGSTKLLALCKAEDIQSAINRAMYQEKILHCVHIQDIRGNGWETITGVTTLTASAKMLMNIRDTVIRAARTLIRE